jgi:hypothetical protein
MESRPNSLHSSPAILLKSFQSLNDPYSLNFLASVHSTMQTIKIALLTFLCLSAAVATAAPMTEAQLERTINTAQSIMNWLAFEDAPVRAQPGDRAASTAVVRGSSGRRSVTWRSLKFSPLQSFHFIISLLSLHFFYNKFKIKKNDSIKY